MPTKKSSSSQAKPLTSKTTPKKGSKTEALKNNEPSKIITSKNDKSPKSTATKIEKPKKSRKLTKSRKSAKSAKTIKSTKTAKNPKSAKSFPKISQDTLEVFSRKKLEKTLKIDAKALGIPAGAAEIFIERALDAAEKSLGAKKLVTEKELTAAIAKELKKYHADFAYIYQNRDKIV